MSLTIKINPCAVAKNWQLFNDAVAPEVSVAACIKSNGYGLGLEPTVTALLMQGAKDFFVTDLDEGLSTRKTVGPEPNVFVLGGFSEVQADACRLARLIPILNSAESFFAYIKSGDNGDYGLQIETGLNRLGFSERELRDIAPILPDRPPAIVLSHLACAEDPKSPSNFEQLRRFKRLTRSLPLGRKTKLSISGSDGVFLAREFHLDMVRPGISLYCEDARLGSQDALQISAQAQRSKWIPAGSLVGYGHTWRASRQTRITVLEIGYSHGLPRVYDGSLEFFANGIACPVIGRISMDLTTIDTTDIAEVPETFELIGPSQSLRRLAHSTGQIPNSLLTSFAPSLRENVRFDSVSRSSHHRAA